MLFNSPLFALFLPLSCLTFYAILLTLRSINQKTANNAAKSSLFIAIYLLMISGLFYASWNPLYILPLVWISLVDFAVSTGLGRLPSLKARRLLLAISLLNSLGILAWFKYSYFIADNLALNGLIVGINMAYFQAIVLPVGISFYTFQSISYVVDVYRREIEPEKNYAHYLLFLLFFPQLVAGPIVTAKLFLPQIQNFWNRERLSFGFAFFLILLGLFKKMILADHLALPSDFSFNHTEQLNPMSLWIGLFAYSLQIYCDFSGYTDIAQGSALLFGFRLPENFRMPYLSAGFSEFWTRWHISLSSWLKSYLYIPLGGNRNGSFFTYRNIMIVMLLGGLWHGASWNFVLWGAGHGFFLILERKFSFLPQFSSPFGLKFGIVFRVGFTFLIVTLLWIFFRSPDFSTSLCYLQGLFSKNGDFSLPYSFQMYFIYSCLVIGFGHFFGIKYFNSNEQMLFGVEKSLNSPIKMLVFGIFSAISLVLLVLYSANSLPFVYFVF